MFAAEEYAKNHADYVSNSWGQAEFANEGDYDGRLGHSRATIFFAAGDSSSPVYPASSPAVISVGATTLTYGSSGGISESAWSSSGGGCSSYESASPAQLSFEYYKQVGCNGRRATPDVAANGAQSSAVSVYDASPYNGQIGWWRVYGTSAPTPMWAARAADAGVDLNPTDIYGSVINYRTVTSGSNANPCLAGYNLCAGRGSWMG